MTSETLWNVVFNSESYENDVGRTMLGETIRVAMHRRWFPNDDVDFFKEEDGDDDSWSRTLQFFLAIYHHHHESKEEEEEEEEHEDDVVMKSTMGETIRALETNALTLKMMRRKCRDSNLFLPFTNVSFFICFLHALKERYGKELIIVKPINANSNVYFESSHLRRERRFHFAHFCSFDDDDDNNKEDVLNEIDNLIRTFDERRPWTYESAKRSFSFCRFVKNPLRQLSSSSSSPPSFLNRWFDGGDLQYFIDCLRIYHHRYCLHGRRRNNFLESTFTGSLDAGFDAYSSYNNNDTSEKLVSHWTLRTAVRNYLFRTRWSETFDDFIRFHRIFTGLYETMMTHRQNSENSDDQKVASGAAAAARYEHPRRRRDTKRDNTLTMVDLALVFYDHYRIAFKKDDRLDGVSAAATTTTCRHYSLNLRRRRRKNNDNNSENDADDSTMVLDRDRTIVGSIDDVCEHVISTPDRLLSVRDLKRLLSGHVVSSSSRRKNNKNNKNNEEEEEEEEEYVDAELRRRIATRKKKEKRHDASKGNRVHYRFENDAFFELLRRLERCGWIVRRRMSIGYPHPSIINNNEDFASSSSKRVAETNKTGYVLNPYVLHWIHDTQCRLLETPNEEEEEEEEEQHYPACCIRELSHRFMSKFGDAASEEEEYEWETLFLAS